MKLRFSLLVLLSLILTLGARQPVAHAIVINFEEPSSETGLVTVGLSADAQTCPGPTPTVGQTPCVLPTIARQESAEVDLLVPKGSIPFRSLEQIATGFLFENVQPLGPLSDRVIIELLEGPNAALDKIAVNFDSESAANPLGNAQDPGADFRVVESSSSPSLDREGFFTLKFFELPAATPVPTTFNLFGSTIRVKSDIEEVPEASTLLLIGSGLAIVNIFARSQQYLRRRRRSGKSDGF
jgi:hypothetical protein